MPYRKRHIESPHLTEREVAEYVQGRRTKEEHVQGCHYCKCCVNALCHALRKPLEFPNEIPQAA